MKETHIFSDLKTKKQVFPPIEDKTQLEAKIIEPKSKISYKNIYRVVKDPETNEKILEVSPFNTLFKEALTEDITTSNFDLNSKQIIELELFLAQYLQKIAILSGFPFKNDSLDLRDCADYFVDFAVTDIQLCKSVDGFGAKIIKSLFNIGTYTQKVEEFLKNEGKKRWFSWKK